MFCAMMVIACAGARRRRLGGERLRMAARTSGGRSVEVLVMSSTMLSKKAGSIGQYNTLAIRGRFRGHGGPRIRFGRLKYPGLTARLSLEVSRWTDIAV